MPLFPALKRHRQADLVEFKDSQSYREVSQEKKKSINEKYGHWLGCPHSSGWY